MNNQWRMSPIEPTAEMEEAGCQAYMDAEGMIGIMHKSSMGHAFKAMLAASPGPPAGDVEVLKTQYRVSAGPQTGWSLWGDGNGNSFRNSYQVEVRELVDRAHVTRLETEVAAQYAKRVEAVEEVTRLTAERDGLRAEVERLKEGKALVEIAASQVVKAKDHAQSELTKALELLERLRSCKWNPTAEWQQEVSELLTRQSAPAAKGDE